MSLNLLKRSESLNPLTATEHDNNLTAIEDFASDVNLTSTNSNVGDAAGASLSSGTSNTYLGKSAGNANATGSNQVAVGHNALLFATGDGNTAIGALAM